MKKFLCVLLGLCVTAALAHADVAKNRRSVAAKFDTCEAILREFMADPKLAIPAEVLQKAKGIVIVNQVKAGALLGFNAGYATIIVKKPNGRWSNPVLLYAGEASLGVQLGGARIEKIYTIMNEEPIRMLYEGRVNIGVDAKAVMGPRVADKEAFNRSLLTMPFLVYTRQVGLFAGTSVKSGNISRNDPANRRFYGVDFDLPELLYGEWIQAPVEAKPLMSYLTELAP